MNKIHTLFFLLIFGIQGITAQELVEVAVGASYANQAYYTLSNDNVTTVDNQSWDLAFMMNPGGAGILFNESIDIAFAGPAPELKLYITYEEDFSSIIDPELLTDSLYNDEADWQNGGFNRIAEEDSPLDYGWGMLNESNGIIEGLWVYVLKLRDGSWKKIKIESLDGGVYTMIYADPNGENEGTMTIDKANYNSPMAFFSFAAETVVPSPDNWDLVFQRYLAPLGSGGDVIEYPTTGVLTAAGIEVAEARGIVPADVTYDIYADSLGMENDIIGHDWKYFDLGGFQWVVEPDRAYFLKMADNHLWKINFINFAGSSSGNMVFEKTDLGVITTTTNPASNFKEAAIFPNPVASQFTLTFSLKEARENVQLQLFNALGQIVWQATATADEGLNVLTFQSPDLPAGYYQLVVGGAHDSWTTAVLLK